MPGRRPSRHAAPVPRPLRHRGRPRPLPCRSSIGRRPRCPTRTIPYFLTTGRVLAQYQSGTQTRRVPELAKAEPEPFVEIHPDTAGGLGIAAGDKVRLTTRRGRAVMKARLTRDIRLDTRVRAVPLGRRRLRQFADRPGARSDLEDSRIQGLRGPHREGRGAAAARGANAGIDPVERVRTMEASTAISARRLSLQGRRPRQAGAARRQARLHRSRRTSGRSSSICAPATRARSSSISC